MIYLLKWALGLIGIVFHAIFIGAGCVVLTVFLWDGSYLEDASNSQERLIKKLF